MNIETVEELQEEWNKVKGELEKVRNPYSQEQVQCAQLNQLLAKALELEAKKLISDIAEYSVTQKYISISKSSGKDDVLVFQIKKKVEENKLDLLKDLLKEKRVGLLLKLDESAASAIYFKAIKNKDADLAKYVLKHVGNLSRQPGWKTITTIERFFATALNQRNEIAINHLWENAPEDLKVKLFLLEEKNILLNPKLKNASKSEKIFIICLSKYLFSKRSETRKLKSAFANYAFKNSIKNYPALPIGSEKGAFTPTRKGVLFFKKSFDAAFSSLVKIKGLNYLLSSAERCLEFDNPIFLEEILKIFSSKQEVEKQKLYMQLNINYQKFSKELKEVVYRYMNFSAKDKEKEITGMIVRYRNLMKGFFESDFCTKELLFLDKNPDSSLWEFISTHLGFDFPRIIKARINQVKDTFVVFTEGARQGGISNKSTAFKILLENNIFSNLCPGIEKHIHKVENNMETFHKKRNIAITLQRKEQKM